MGNGISEHHARSLLKIGFGGAAVLIALWVASSISWRAVSLTPAQIETQRHPGEWRPAK